MAVRIPPTPRPQTVFNLLPSEDAKLLTSIGTWNSFDAVLSVEYDEILKPGFNSLKIQPDTLGPVTITCGAVRSNQNQVNDSYVFHGRIKSTLDVDVAVKLEREGQTTSVLTQSAAQRWTIIRSAPVRVPPSSDLHDFQVSLTFTNHNGAAIYLTLPTLMLDFVFTKNDFVREMVTVFPGNLLSLDAQQETPSYPLSRLMDVGLGYANMAFTQFSNLRGIDVVGDGTPEVGIATLQTLIESLGNNRFVLVWLSQFLGVRLKDPVLGSTPWGNLPTTWQDIMQEVWPAPNLAAAVTSITRVGSSVTATLAGPYAATIVGASIAQTITISITGTVEFNGQFQITGQNLGALTVSWTDDGAATTEATGTATVVDTVWIALEAYATDLTELYNYLKWQVAAPYFGRDAGTVTALREATAIGLLGGRSVTVIPNYLGDPWTIKIYTKTAETPGGVEGEPSPYVLASVAPAKPAGFVLLHECNEAGTDRVFVLGDAEDGILSEDYL